MTQQPKYALVSYSEDQSTQIMAEFEEESGVFVLNEPFTIDSIDEFTNELVNPDIILFVELLREDYSFQVLSFATMVVKNTAGLPASMFINSHMKGGVLEDYANDVFLEFKHMLDQAKEKADSGQSKIVPVLNNTTIH